MEKKNNILCKEVSEIERKIMYQKKVIDLKDEELSFLKSLLHDRGDKLAEGFSPLVDSSTSCSSGIKEREREENKEKAKVNSETEDMAVRDWAGLSKYMKGKKENGEDIKTEAVELEEESARTEGSSALSTAGDSS